MIRTGLELLHVRTHASVVGFLWVSDDGEHLNTQMVLPEQPSNRVPLSEALTRLVLLDRRAVWIANQRSQRQSDSLQHYADALCVPLLNEGQVVGAIHVYLEQGRFRQAHFDFAISVANILAVALVRARYEQSLEVSYERLKQKSAGTDELIGASPPMAELKNKISRLGRTSGGVLVVGESGSGKELVARALHRASNRVPTGRC